MLPRHTASKTGTDSTAAWAVGETLFQPDKRIKRKKDELPLFGVGN